MAQVLFFADLYQAGKPRGSVELSDFRHDGTGWRYVGGVLRAVSTLPGPPEALSLESWERLPPPH